MKDKHSYQCSGFVNGRICDNGYRVRRDLLEDRLLVAPTDVERGRATLNGLIRPIWISPRDGVAGVQAYQCARAPAFWNAHHRFPISSPHMSSIRCALLRLANDRGRSNEMA